MNCKNLIQASELFLISDDFYSNKGAAQKNIQSVLNKHLLPFFKDMEFIDITDDLIDKFKIQKTSESYCPASILIFLNILQKLVSRYSKVEVKNYYTEAKTVDTELILTEEEMIKLLNKTQRSKLYIPLLLISGLGLTLAEIKAIRSEDINLKTNKISVNKIIVNNELQKYRTRYQIREIYVLKSLRNILKKLTPQDFENFKKINDAALKRLSNKEVTFIDLHNSYVNNLIQKKFI